MFKRFIPYLIIILLSILSVISLFHSGIYPTHDAEYHIIRFYEFYKVFMSGSFYPRWAPDLNYGFGVPLFNYVYPLPNYFSLLLHIFGISFIDSFKVNMVVATITGGIFFYLWAKEFWGKWGGITSTVFYLYSPYRFVDIYIRGSVGEVWAIALFPACLYFVTNYAKKGKTLSFLLSAIFLSLVIFSHNILALLFFCFLIIYAVFLFLIEKKDSRFLIHFLYILLIALGLSAVFWLPALLEKKFVTGLEIYNVSNNFPELFQLLIPSWGSSFSGVNLNNQMSFQLGIMNLFAILLSAFSLSIFIKKKNKKIGFIILFFLIVFIITFFLMLRESLFVWKIIPLLNYFQFPWRFLSLVIIIAPFLAGSFIYLLKGNRKIIVSILFIFCAILLAWNYARPAHYFARDDAYYIFRPNFIDGTNSPGNLFNTIWWNNSIKKREINKLSLFNNELKILSQDIQPTRYLFRVLSAYSVIREINLAYFPDWQVLVDGKEVKISPTKNGLIAFNLEKGTHWVEIKLLDTPIRKIAAFISAISLFIILLLIFF